MSELLYQSVGGSADARRTGSLLLGRLGLGTEADQTVVMAGGQNALHDHPTTATVRATERQLIAELVLERRIQLIEDDVYRLLDPKPLLPISTYVPEQTCPANGYHLWLTLPAGV